MEDSKDVCYNCEAELGTCVAPKKLEDCEKNCSVCKFHRCKQRNKCPKIYGKQEKKK